MTLTKSILMWGVITVNPLENNDISEYLNCAPIIRAFCGIV